VTLKMIAVSPKVGPNYVSQVASVLVSDAGHTQILHPEDRYFTEVQTNLAKVAIWRQWWRDIYVVMGQPLGEDRYAIRIYLRPGVRWIWLGGLCMVLAGWIGLWRRR
jgi:cytochrome c-type biogenesis protein CcmF